MIDLGLIVDGTPVVFHDKAPEEDRGAIETGDPLSEIVRDTPAIDIIQSAPVTNTKDVTTTKVGTAESVYLLKPAERWTWEDLRDYVITEAERRFGPQIRNPAKESGIFKSFIGRHGTVNAVLVAQAAFEVYNGVWASAPITVTRFCKGSDEYFAQVILSRVKG